MFMEDNAWSRLGLERRDLKEGPESVKILLGRRYLKAKVFNPEMTDSLVLSDMRLQQIAPEARSPAISMLTEWWINGYSMEENLFRS